MGQQVGVQIRWGRNLEVVEPLEGAWPTKPQTQQDSKFYKTKQTALTRIWLAIWSQINDDDISFHPSQDYKWEPQTSTFEVSPSDTLPGTFSQLGLQMDTGLPSTDQVWMLVKTQFGAYFFLNFSLFFCSFYFCFL